ncbi:hypothetical protein C8R45DRAFT_555530 [Mycena sanguinolenta]|nr:hypothetical protein C8R45DRAFT_555530 [Mycena sanguinolenta]
MLQCRPLRRLARRGAHHHAHTSRQVRRPGWVIPALADELNAREGIVRLPVGEERRRCGRRVCNGRESWRGKGQCRPCYRRLRSLLLPSVSLALRHPDLLPLGTTNGKHAPCTSSSFSASPPLLPPLCATSRRCRGLRRPRAPRREDPVSCVRSGRAPP